MSEYHKRITGSILQRRNRAILRASDVCHICGHAGADAIDHIVALARGGTEERDNLAPAHHDVPCPTCGERCNRVKGAKEWAPIVRRSGALRRPNN